MKKMMKISFIYLLILFAGMLVIESEDIAAATKCKYTSANMKVCTTTKEGYKSYYKKTYYTYYPKSKVVIQYKQYIKRKNGKMLQRTVKKYENQFIVKYEVLKYNKAGQLKSNKKYGSAYKLVKTYYKKGKIESYTKYKYNAKGKAIKYYYKKYHDWGNVPKKYQSYRFVYNNVKYMPSSLTSLIGSKGKMIDVLKFKINSETATIPLSWFVDGKNFDYSITLKKVENNLKNDIIKKTSDLRKSCGMNTLKYNATLEEIADIRANELTVKFSHTRPNGTYYWSIYNEYNLTGKNGENATKGGFFNNAFDSWYESLAHRYGMFGYAFDDIAIGIKTDIFNEMQYYTMELYDSDDSNNDNQRSIYQNAKCTAIKELK